MRWLLVMLLLAGQAAADTVVARHTLPARTVLGPDDLALQGGETAGGLDAPALAIGMELRTAVYAGRPILAANLRAQTIVERNQLVTLVYARGGLVIRAEGRTLDRAGSGDIVRVMNVASRTTLTGRVGPDGAIWITATQ